MYAIPVFPINLIDPTMIQKVIEVIPTWLLNGIANAGNMLPALGFALTLVMLWANSICLTSCWDSSLLCNYRLLHADRWAIIAFCPG